MKKQTTVRMSEATRARAEALAQQYGTITEVIAVAIDRLYVAANDDLRPSLSRQELATITYSEWEKRGTLHWLIIRTNRTGGREFMRVGADDKNLPAASQLADGFAVGDTITIGDLRTIPIITEQVMSTICPGVNMHIGFMDDGLGDLCGPLVFSRIVDMTGSHVQTQSEIADLKAATVVFVRHGQRVAAAFLNRRGYQRLDWRQVGGPAINDPCVREVHHQSGIEA